MKRETKSLPAAAAVQQPCKDRVMYCDGEKVFCVALSSRLQDGHKKGINAAPMMNLRTGEDMAPLILYKPSASDHGLILNYCPWCGGALNRKIIEEHMKVKF